MDGWSDSEWLTLQLGPVWVISALVGRNRFDALEADGIRAARLLPLHRGQRPRSCESPGVVGFRGSVSRPR